MIENADSYQCYVCEIFTAFYEFGSQYGKDIYRELLSPSRLLFEAYVGMWIVWYLIFKGMLKGDLRASYFLKNSFLFVFVESLLRGSDFFWEFIHTPFLNLIAALSQKIITLGRVPLNAPTFQGTLYTVDQSLNKTVFQVWNMLIGEAGWLSWKPILAAIILMIPYLLVICLFLAFMLEFVFTSLVITAICPLLYIIICFKPVRFIALSALRVALHGALSLLFSSVAMGFTLEVFHKFSPIIPVGDKGAYAEISSFIFSSQYWAIWVLGFLSVFFHLKASYFARQISCLSGDSVSLTSNFEEGRALIPASLKKM